MKRLKELRVNAGYTQERLAEMLDVTQQTIERWESGKAEPNLQATRDIAVIFGTSVDNLLEFDSGKAEVLKTNHYHRILGSGQDGFWGHLGVMLPNETKSIWYPITEQEMTSIDSQAQRTDTGWLCAATLNNRMVLLNVKEIKKITLIDDDEDQIESDWELEWDGYQGHSPEIYKALGEHFYGIEDEYEESFSNKLRKFVEELVEEHQIDEDKVIEILSLTKIHFIDGTKLSIEIDEQDLCHIVMEAGIDLPDIFSFDEADRGRYFYIPPAKVQMIDMPLLKYQEGIERSRREESRNKGGEGE